MKPKTTTSKWCPWTLLVLGALPQIGCMTTYDAYGRPVQSVDPGAAVAGAAVAGLAGYAIGNSHDHHHHHHDGYYNRGYYGRGYYRRGYYR